MKNILLALDCKPADEILIDHARNQSKLNNAKIWLVHIAAPDPDFVGYKVGPTYIRESRASELSNEHSYLQKKMNTLINEGIESEALLIQGPTIEMLEEETTKLNIDLLIMGSHRHSWLYEVFVGHSAVKLIGHLNVPLLIIPLPDEN